MHALGAVARCGHALARYRPDGSLDTNFGEAGKTLTGFGSDSSVEDIAIQRGGKIVVASP